MEQGSIFFSSLECTHPTHTKEPPMPEPEIPNQQTLSAHLRHCDPSSDPVAAKILMRRAADRLEEYEHRMVILINKAEHPRARGHMDLGGET
jgi:hypothetical protein